MIKEILATVSLLSVTGIFAQDGLTIRKLATDNATKSVFHQMAKGHQLPIWVMVGGTNAPVQAVTLNNKIYQIISACKPHDCTSEQMAVIYSPDNNDMSGLYSVVDEKNGQQTLEWLNINDELSIDGKTVLFAALSGSLENHPDAFNFK
ncbi:Ivy family C-type lysozyme inhibitor [Citrobacter koseri]|uniref:Ivy family C-type lysozyme inhibitor n=1 Tax=Citrobacter koseri TaxID=545 RepID=UPI001B97FB67|nr:Ivy family C-type lysozyme inhibitor [Citrobacter koseri]MEB2728473.1 Ivy family C-type lysozyme inhibitor [Citrobacter koseri]HBC9089502.1 Ivy family C-type lysozyme inhibitor [Citrobacter koseri]